MSWKRGNMSRSLRNICNVCKYVRIQKQTFIRRAERCFTGREQNKCRDQLFFLKKAAAVIIIFLGPTCV